VSSRAVRAGRAFASLTSLFLAGCPLDERTLEPLPPIQWIDSGSSGQAGDGEGGAPNIFQGGSSGTRGGGGGTAGKEESGGSSGASGGGSAGTAGIAGTSGGLPGDAGAPGSVAPGCEDLDSDSVPDCDETLVKNSSFDANVAHWNADDSVMQDWARDDADAHDSSGSLTLTNTTSEDVNGYTMSGTAQCVPVDETSSYHFVAELYVPEGQGEGNGGVNLWFFNLPNCEGSIVSATTKLEGVTGKWQLVYANPVTPMDAHSVAVRLVAAKPYRNPKFAVSFDNVLFVKN